MYSTPLTALYGRTVETTVDQRYEESEQEEGDGVGEGEEKGVEGRGQAKDRAQQANGITGDQIIHEHTQDDPGKDGDGSDLADILYVHPRSIIVTTQSTIPAVTLIS